MYDAFVKLSEEAQCVTKPVKHTDGKAGTAIEQTAKEIVDVIYDCPRFVLSSRDLCMVPIVSSSNSDVVPNGSRMEQLEKNVQLLVKGFQDMKNAPPPASFARVATAGTIGNQGRTQQVGEGVQSGGGGGRGGSAFGGARSRVNSLSGRGGIFGGQRERLPSEN